MEIYTEVKRFSFYENSATFYIECKLIQKRIDPNCHPFKHQFEELNIGEVINLKADRNLLERGKLNFEELAVILLNRFLIFKIDTWEPAVATFHKSTPKFGLVDARQCDIFPEK